MALETARVAQLALEAGFPQLRKIRTDRQHVQGKGVRYVSNVALFLKLTCNSVVSNIVLFSARKCAEKFSDLS